MGIDILARAMASGKGGGGGDTSPALVNTTWAQLRGLRYMGALVPGAQYRITDYVCTVANDANARVESHPYDIIVVADSTYSLNENARAALKENDAYYRKGTNNAVLDAWELKYCFDNNTERFAWADQTNGKGVVYWLKDDRGNECWYDFKQIQFKRYKITACSQNADMVGKYTAGKWADDNTLDSSNPKWFFTFSGTDSRGRVFDTSVNKEYQNTVYLNKTDYALNQYGALVLGNNTFFGACSDNTLGSSCKFNTFYEGFDRNTFGPECTSNLFLENSTANKFGEKCTLLWASTRFAHNSFAGDNQSMMFLQDCHDNTFGYSSGYNKFGFNCLFNKFYNNCQNFNLGNYCMNNIVEGNYYIGAQFADEASDYRVFTYGATDESAQAFNLPVNTSNDTIFVVLNSLGEPKFWNLTNAAT